MGIFRALITYLSDGGTIPIDRSLRDAYRPVYFGDVAGIPVPILISLAVAGVGAFLLYRTKFGRRCVAVGANEPPAPAPTDEVPPRFLLVGSLTIKDNRLRCRHQGVALDGMVGHMISSRITGNDIIGTSSEVNDADGALVCSTSATLVHRGADA